LHEKETEYNSLRIKAEELLYKEIEKLKESGLNEEVFLELKNLLFEADTAKQNNNIELALTLIKSFSSKLTELPYSIEKSFFQENTEKIMNNAENALKTAELLGLSKKLSKTKNELIELEKEMNSFLIQGKIGSAEKTINKMNEKEKELNELLQKEILNSLNELNLKTINKIQKLNELPEKLIELKKLMTDFDKLKDLMDYVPPTTLKRIQSIEKEFNLFPLNEMNKLLNEIKLNEQSNPEKALNQLTEFNSKYENELIKIESFYNEVNDSLQKIMQDSTIYFNLAGKQANNEKALEALEKAKQSIENKEFIKSIAFSKTAMLSTSTGTEIDLNNFPIAIIPFILIVIGVIAFKWKQKEEEKKPKKKRKINGID
jgi:hypothetical protein